MGAGQPWMPGRPDHQYQVGVAAAYSAHRCVGTGVGVLLELQSGVARHEFGIAVGEGGQRCRTRQACGQGAQRGSGGDADLAAGQPSMQLHVLGRSDRQQKQGQQQEEGGVPVGVVAPLHAASCGRRMA